MNREGKQKQSGLRPKAAANGTKGCAVSHIMNVNVSQDKFILCLGGFLLVAVCLAGYGVVLASQMNFNKPLTTVNLDDLSPRDLTYSAVEMV